MLSQVTLSGSSPGATISAAERPGCLSNNPMNVHFALDFWTSQYNLAEGRSALKYPARLLSGPA